MILTSTERRSLNLFRLIETHSEDRSYTRQEIAELLRQSTDERFRAVILLMANGLRVGAIPELERKT